MGGETQDPLRNAEEPSSMPPSQIVDGKSDSFMMASTQKRQRESSGDDEGDEKGLVQANKKACATSSYRSGDIFTTNKENLSINSSQSKSSDAPEDTDIFGLSCTNVSRKRQLPDSEKISLKSQEKRIRHEEIDGDDDIFGFGETPLSKKLSSISNVFKSDKIKDTEDDNILDFGDHVQKSHSL